MNDIALNHRVAPLAGLEEFFDLASALGVTKVEIRNDLPGRPIADGVSPVEVRRQAEARGLTLLSINALYPFNIWTDRMAAQARALIGIAAECGAQAIVMCPLNEASAATDAERAAGLRQSLEQLAPMLRASGVIGLVEPLGFPECSLRFKREAVEAIADVGGNDVFRLVHDTFHHAVAGETDMFPNQTGLVHISGVTDPDVDVALLRDPHRVLVDADDRIGNLAQIRDIVAGGYAGPLSFEPFADSVTHAPDIRRALSDSIAVVRSALSPTR